MNAGRENAYALRAVLLAAIGAGSALAIVAVRPLLQRGTAGPYTGSLECRRCHERFYDLWSTSFHGLAMRPFTPELASTLPPSGPRRIGDASYRVELGPGGGAMIEEGPRGTLRHPIAHALGGKNVFYFLTPLGRGRLQTLPLAFDVNRKEWYDTAASAVRHFPDVRDEKMDWRDPAYTFNTSCHSCHVSQLTNNYDPATGSYRTTWAEPGINCETCHGPAAEHVRLFENAPAGQPPRDPRIIVTKALTPRQRNDMCSGCHAKMIPITPSFTPGERYFDHYDLICLENPDFYPDGRDLGENFTLTTWLMSPCLKSPQFECMHCHTSSGRYRFRAGDPNGACLPCHEARVRDAEAHSRHKPGTAGGRCTDCHMPMTEFARMRRSDHSMRPPTPAATIAFKSPNACNICHADKDAAWADNLVRQWHRDDYQAPVLRRASLVEAARNRRWDRLDEMLSFIRRPEGDEITAASIVRLLGACDDGRKWPVLLDALKDPSPLVRSSAASGLAGHLTTETVKALLAAVRDDCRLVRVRAAAALSPLPPQAAPPEDRQALERANRELEASFTARMDDWASRYNLGNVYLERGDAARAAAEYEAATRLRPDTVAPWVNLAMAQARLGRPSAAESSLRRALAVEPGNPAARFNLGLLLAEKGSIPEAEAELRAALAADPGHSQAAYNLGLLVMDSNPAEGLRLLAKAWSLRPDEPRYGYSLGFHRARQGLRAEAISTLKETASLHPAHADCVLLLAELLLAEGGRAAEAEAACRRALASPLLDPRDRARIESFLRNPALRR